MNLRLVLSCGTVATAVALAADAPVALTPEALLENYKKLTRITVEPKSISAEMAGACAISLAWVKVQDETGPHAMRYVNYYLNDAAERHRRSGAESDYPAGSVIVKEKMFPGDATQKPDFLRVEAVAGMIKGQPGSRPKTRDWEFFYYEREYDYNDRGGKKPSPWKQAKEVQHCAGCHSNAQDMVFPKMGEAYRAPRTTLEEERSFTEELGKNSVLKPVK